MFLVSQTKAADGHATSASADGRSSRARAADREPEAGGTGATAHSSRFANHGAEVQAETHAREENAARYHSAGEYNSRAEAGRASERHATAAHCDPGSRRHRACEPGHG